MTEKVNDVDVLPEPGLTDPDRSETWWLADLQDAARTGAAPNSAAAASATSASTTIRRDDPTSMWQLSYWRRVGGRAPRG